MNSALEDMPNTSGGAPIWRHMARSRLWDVMAVAVALASLVRYAELMPQAARASDFSHYYLSCRMLLEGRSPYATPLVSMAKQYDLVLSPDSTTGTNPPVLQWLFVPFAMLNPRAAFWLWSSLQAVALGVILWLTRILLADRLTTRAWRFVVCGAVASVPMVIHFTESQTQLLVGALMLAALALLLKEQPTAACLTAVAAGLVKLFPFVLLPWFVWRGGRTWRQRAVLAGVSLAAVGVGVVISGPSLWQDFIQHGLPSVGYWSRNFTFNYCLASLVTHCGGSWNARRGRGMPGTGGRVWTVRAPARRHGSAVLSPGPGHARGRDNLLVTLHGAGHFPGGRHGGARVGQPVSGTGAPVRRGGDGVGQRGRANFGVPGGMASGQTVLGLHALVRPTGPGGDVRDPTEPPGERDHATSKWLITLNRSYRSLISGWVSDWSRLRLKSSTQYEAITLP